MATVSNTHPELGKRLIKVLRHNKDTNRIFDNEGYTDLSLLLKSLGYKDVTLEEIQHIVSSCSKQRFSLKEYSGSNESNGNLAGWSIRANQGHSFELDSESLFTLIEDPALYDNLWHGCFHGTNKNALVHIQHDGGLSVMCRTHIHIATSKDAMSGHRKSCNVFIYIDIKKAMSDGIKFYLSSNGVILTRGKDERGFLPSTYFSRIEVLD
jgi:2'-phosphotransferase